MSYSESRNNESRDNFLKTWAVWTIEGKSAGVRELHHLVVDEVLQREKEVLAAYTADRFKARTTRPYHTVDAKGDPIIINEKALDDAFLTAIAKESARYSGSKVPSLTIMDNTVEIAAVFIDLKQKMDEAPTSVQDIIKLKYYFKRQPAHIIERQVKNFTGNELELRRKRKQMENKVYGAIALARSFVE